MERMSLETLYQPTLVALSTSVVQSNCMLECPRNILRILCASTGECMLCSTGCNTHLVGTRVVLMAGPFNYRFTNPTDDFRLIQVDIGLGQGRFNGFSLSELETVFPGLAKILHMPNQNVVFYDNYSFVLTAVQNLHSFSLYDTPDREMQITLTLYFLLSAAAAASGEGSLSGKQCSKYVRNALQYIHENYMCHITTSDIAKSAGIHIGHLHRVFPAETGYRVGEYLTRLRIDKAKSLLMRTDLPSAMIAYCIGVSTSQYFSRLFKQKVGMTPQEFRRSYNLTCQYPASRYAGCTMREMPMEDTP